MKLKFFIGIFYASLLILFAACVKDTVIKQTQFEAEKAELLKAKVEMTKSFKSTADALRATGKKYYGMPHNGKSSVDPKAFLHDFTDELSRQRPDLQPNTTIRVTKAWDPKKENLKDYMSANGASKNVITFAKTLKENLEVAGKKYSAKINSGELDVKDMLTSITEVFQNMEKEIINDHTLTESEKLSLLAATTAGMELTPAAAEVYQDAINNQINRAESWAWLRALGNFLITVAVVVAAVIIVFALAEAAAAAGFVGLAVLLVTFGSLEGANIVLTALYDCVGICIFPDDNCFCPI